MPPADASSSPAPQPFTPPPAQPASLLRTSRLIALGVLVLALLGIGAYLATRDKGIKSLTSSSATATGIQYLGFYAGGAGPALLLPQGTSAAVVSSRTDLEKAWDDIITRVGEKGDHKTREIGFWVGPIGWDLTDGQTKQLIDDAFAVAEEKDVAVGFHIEDSMFWVNRKDLWSDKKNVEWSDWNGAVVSHRIIGWVADGAPILAPPICFNSPAITKEATRLATDVIGAEIKKNIDKLHSEGKDYLFMGIIAGWETRLQDDSHNPHIDYGYCALHNLGYGAAKPPSNLHKVLQGVTASWVALWTKSLSIAGIPRDKIFTHIASTDESAPCDSVNDYCQDALASIAFTDYSNPGFTVYGSPAFEDLYKTLDTHGDPPWGVSEGTQVGLQDAFSGAGAKIDTSGMETYLAGIFNHGGVYVDLFGWGDTTQAGQASSFAEATTGDAAIAAYQKFLKGETLVESKVEKPSSKSPCPNTLPSDAPSNLQNLCDELVAAEQAGTVTYPLGPLKNIHMLNIAVSDAIRKGNYANAGTLMHAALRK